MLEVALDVIEGFVSEVIERIVNRFSKNTGKQENGGGSVADNTNLTRDKAVELLKGLDVFCPKCGKAKLVPLHSNKNQRTRYKCPACEEVYRPIRLI